MIKIFGYQLNWTDYLALVTLIVVGAEYYAKAHGVGSGISIYAFIAPFVVFGIDKVLRIGSYVFGGYRQFRRILFIFALSAVTVYAVYNIATGGDIERMRGYVAILGFLVAIAAYEMIEKLLTGQAGVRRMTLDTIRQHEGVKDDIVKDRQNCVPGEYSKIDGRLF